MTKQKIIHGYDGPVGAYAVVDGRILSLAEDPSALTALANSAMLTGLGISPQANEFATALSADRLSA